MNFCNKLECLSLTSLQVLHCRVGSSLTHKHQTRLEKLARDNCSSLTQNFITYDRKKFYNIGLRSLAQLSQPVQKTEQSKLIQSCFSLFCLCSAGFKPLNLDTNVDGSTTEAKSARKYQPQLLITVLKIFTGLGAKEPQTNHSPGVNVKKLLSSFLT